MIFISKVLGDCLKKAHKDSQLVLLCSSSTSYYMNSTFLKSSIKLSVMNLIFLSYKMRCFEKMGVLLILVSHTLPS